MGIDNKFLSSSADIDTKNMITSPEELGTFMKDFGTNLQEIPDWRASYAAGDVTCALDD